MNGRSSSTGVSSPPVSGPRDSWRCSITQTSSSSTATPVGVSEAVEQHRRRLVRVGIDDEDLPGAVTLAAGELGDDEAAVGQQDDLRRADQPGDDLASR